MAGSADRDRKGLGRAAYLLVAFLGEQVDRAFAAQDAILGVQPLADAPRGQRVRKQQNDVAQLREPVVPVRSDVAGH